jgi:hypothetical protein
VYRRGYKFALATFIFGILMGLLVIQEHLVGGTVLMTIGVVSAWLASQVLKWEFEYKEWSITKRYEMRCREREDGHTRNVG